jgi:hypothetical protein
MAEIREHATSFLLRRVQMPEQSTAVLDNLSFRIFMENFSPEDALFFSRIVCGATNI